MTYQKLLLVLEYFKVILSMACLCLIYFLTILFQEKDSFLYVETCLSFFLCHMGE